jgi:hypothetical protein
LQRVRRKSGESVWVFRWYEIQPDGSKKYRKAVIGSVEEFKTAADAQTAADALRLTINEQTPRQQLRQTIQELLRYANYKVTADTYTQAVTPTKRAAQTKLVLFKSATARVAGSPRSCHYAGPQDRLR